MRTTHGRHASKHTRMQRCLQSLTSTIVKTMSKFNVIRRTRGMLAVLRVHAPLTECCR